MRLWELAKETAFVREWRCMNGQPRRGVYLYGSSPKEPSRTAGVTS